MIGWWNLLLYYCVGLLLIFTRRCINASEYSRLCKVIMPLLCTCLFYVFVGLLPPLWSSGQSFWLQIQRSEFDSRRYQIFWEVVGLERVPLSLVSTIEELLGRNSSGSGLENREYGRGVPLRWPRDTLYPQKLALTSLTSGGRSVGIVPLWAKSKEFFLLVYPFVLCGNNIHCTGSIMEHIGGFIRLSAQDMK
jgi:hypothetical protein